MRKKKEVYGPIGFELSITGPQAHEVDAPIYRATKLFFSWLPDFDTTQTYLHYTNMFT